MVVDELLRRAGAQTTKKFHGEYARTTLAGEAVVLLKPMTYMNLSGESVGPCARYFDIPVEETIVVHDELDLDYGDIRVKWAGGHGGHNGLKSIFQFLSRDFTRVRFGIGRGAKDPISHVLGDFGADERIDLDLKIVRASDAVETILTGGLDRARNEFNRRSKEKRPSAASQEENGK